MSFSLWITSEEGDPQQLLASVLEAGAGQRSSGILLQPTSAAAGFCSV